MSLCGSFQGNRFGTDREPAAQRDAIRALEAEILDAGMARDDRLVRAARERLRHVDEVFAACEHQGRGQ
jgi:hypothetical protein